MVRSSPEAPQAASASSNHTMRTTRLALSIFSYNGNIMLAAIISLLLVILFLLLLHIYAKWFLLRARRRRIRRQGSPLTGFLQGFHHFQTFSSFDAAACPAKGLDPSLIASIPIFLYKRNPASFRDEDNNRIRQDLGLECVICLSDFEEDDIGRALAKCGHTFHAECIDMWLHSHTTCPICRAPAVYVYDGSQETNNDDAGRGESVRDVMGATRDWETMIDVEEDNDGSTDREEEEVVSVVMIVSVSVSRAGSARRLAEEDCLAE